MTKEQVRDWIVERNIARDSHQEDLVMRAYDHRDEMMMECIQHQADRVKESLKNDARIELELGEIKLAIAPCVESDKEYRKAKEEAKVVKKFLGISLPLVKKVFETIGAPTAAIIFCKIAGILAN